MAMQLRIKAVLLFTAGFLFCVLALFVPAGTLDYWQAWAYLGTVFIPVAFVGAYFLKSDPEFIERRFRTREKEATQGFVQKAGGVILVLGFLIPALDRRFGWSGMPSGLSIAADALVFLGYALVFLVFRENSYAGRTVRVEKGQKVVSTGPYSAIRHPMYFGVLLIYLATPLALGSYFAVPVFLLTIPLFVLRILNEEKVLERELPGYAEYCERVRYRLVPLVW